MEPYRLLEERYAQHLGVGGVSAVNTGTAALHVALEALQLPHGSKVIIPDFTMYASALAVYYALLTPVFVDCDENLLIDLDALESAIDDDTRVIMVTHIYGRVVNMSKVMKIASKYKLRVIEDACEAQGATWEEKPVGSYDIGCFSLYRNKIIHAEEGGIVASNDLDLIGRVQDMKSMAFGDTHDYFHKTIGFNYRITNSQSTLALESLREADHNIRRREEIKNIYNSIIPSHFQMPNNREVIWVYDMIHPNADAVVKYLKKGGIPARHSFKPMSEQPLFYTSSVGVNAKKYSQKVFYVHLKLSQTNSEIIDIAQKVKQALETIQ